MPYLKDKCQTPYTDYYITETNDFVHQVPCPKDTHSMAGDKQCTKCEPGTGWNENTGICDPCNDKSVTINNKCYTCPYWSIVNKATNTCDCFEKDKYDNCKIPEYDQVAFFLLSHEINNCPYNQIMINDQCECPDNQVNYQDYCLQCPDKYMRNSICTIKHVIDSCRSKEIRF